MSTFFEGTFQTVPNPPRWEPDPKHGYVIRHLGPSKAKVHRETENWVEYSTEYTSWADAAPPKVRITRERKFKCFGGAAHLKKLSSTQLFGQGYIGFNRASGGSKWGAIALPGAPRRRKARHTKVWVHESLLQ